MHSVRGVIGGAAVVLGLLFASPALAAFPGANGLLAVQPVSGGGILLVNSNGHVVRRICTVKKRCGTPRQPRWSPDGRALVFGGSKMSIVFTDGSCMDCIFGPGMGASFTPGGTVISFIQDGRVLRDGIDGLTILSSNPVASDAVWAADGKLAVVRRGVLWAGRRARLRKVARTSEPSWAPGGSAIAAVQHGWVVIVRLRDHHFQRVARGSAPAFSPDGRWLAFVGPGHRLMIISARGGRARPVGNVRGASVDWQPRPRGRNPGCAAPPGSTLLASNSQAVVTANSFAPWLPGIGAVMGCLRANGRERLLERLDNFVNGAIVPSTVLAPPFAALVVKPEDAHYVGYAETVQVFDLRSGNQRSDLGGEHSTCDENNVCGTVDSVVLGSDGVSAAHVEMVAPLGELSTALDQVACAPGTTVCLAIERGRALFTSSNPAAGGQSWIRSAPGWTTVTCPSQSLCVAGGDDIYTSNPAAAPFAWTTTSFPSGPIGASDLSCPTVSYCVLADGVGFAASTNPTGGSGAWTQGAQVNSGDSRFGTVFCSAEPRCFAVSTSDAVVTSTDPAGNASAWTGSPSTPVFTSGVCPTTSLCVITTGQGIATTTDRDAATWTVHPTAGYYGAVTCPSASFCAAVGGPGALAFSTDPASGSWTEETIDGGRTLTSISCASTSLCVASDRYGRVLTSTNPTGGASAWSPVLLDGDPCSDSTPCSLEAIEVADKAGTRIADSSKLPGAGPFLTGVTLNGDTVSWNHDGSPGTATLTPP